MRPETAALLGQRVGHIRVVDVIGEGGMGAVFVGFDDKLQRKVAIKAIRGDYRLSASAKARFQREARILSQLAHPQVCTVFDYIEGDDDDYLVLELVAGRNLRQALNEGLGWSDKLDIFRQLLDILAAVHDHGVIHRDLKPENVMVNDAGQVTVLDFGLARSNDQAVPEDGFPPLDVNATGELDESETFVVRGPGHDGAGSSYVQTKLGTVIGTAGYMSPEQARGEPTTAASDMYALGLIVQEMLTGTPPMEAGLGARTLLERAASGTTRPVQGLPADLTQLITRLKSLAPGSRPSAVDAAAELARILDRPRRRRQRLVVATVWAALVLLAVGMGVQWQRARHEQQRAEREATTATAVSTFLVELFQKADPTMARGQELTVREVLEGASDRVLEELDEQPVVQARLLDTIGTAFKNLGLYDRAEPLLEEALSLRRQHLGADHPEVATSLASLGWLYHLQGRYAESLPLRRESLEIRRRAFGPNDPHTAHSQFDLGAALAQLGEHEEARTLLESALASHERHQLDDLDLGWLLFHLGWIYHLTDDDAAATTLERAVETMATAYGESSPQVGLCLIRLSAVYQTRGEIELARQPCRRALEIYRQVYGPDHPLVADALTNLGNLAWSDRDYAEADRLWQQTLEIQEKAFGPDHPEVAGTLNNLALIANLERRYTDARQLMERSLRIREKVFGRNHVQVAAVLSNLAVLQRTIGEHAEAERHLRRALAIHESVSGAESLATASTLLTLGTLLSQEQRLDEAIDALERAMAIEEQQLGRDGIRPGTSSALAETYREAGRLDEATTMFERSLDRKRALLDEDHPAVVIDLIGLAKIHLVRGEQERAEQLSDQALALSNRLGASAGTAVLVHRAGLAALAGDQDAALRQLQDIADRGFDKLHVLDSTDFTSLRGNPQFKAIRATVERNRRALLSQ